MKTTTKLVLLGIVCWLVFGAIGLWHITGSFEESAEAGPEFVARSCYVGATWGGIGTAILVICLATAWFLWTRRRKLLRR